MASEPDPQLEFWDDTVLPRPPSIERAALADDAFSTRETQLRRREQAIARLEGETGQALIRLRLQAEHERRILYASAEADAARLVADATAEAEQAARASSRRETERVLADARADATRLREQAEELVVVARQEAAKLRAGAREELSRLKVEFDLASRGHLDEIETARARILAEAAAEAEAWLIEADDEWGAIVDRAADAARDKADAVRDRVIAAAELEAEAIVEQGRRVRAHEVHEAEADRARILDAARREHDDIVAAGRRAVEHMQDDADSRIAAEREVILAAADEHARAVLADTERRANEIAERRANEIVEQAEAEAAALRERVADELGPAREHLRAAREDLAELLERSRRLLPALDEATQATEVGPAPRREFRLASAPAEIVSLEREPLIGSGRRDRPEERAAPEPVVDVGDDDAAAGVPRRRLLARLLGR